jgi:hypothetical protein
MSSVQQLESPAGQQDDSTDWDPFIVWRKRVDGKVDASPLSRDPQREASWQPFDVWANHIQQRDR